MTAQPLNEFERIARFFAPLAAPGALQLADDVALIDGPPGEQYVLTADAIVAGVHFLPADPPAEVAQKLLRVNLSDLAAKGAAPFGYLLTIALAPACDESWLADFARGLAADQARFGIALLGGDSVTTPGPTTLSVAAIGRIPAGSAILRRGAMPGDRVYVSGTLGDAALGLAVARGGLAQLDPAARAFLVDRYRLPQPRLALGRRLVGLARAMMDISDGLVADLGHLCEASGGGATLEAALLPLSPAARVAISAEPALASAPLGGGDDYELLFAAPAGAAAALATLAAAEGVPLAEIGRIEAEPGVRVVGPDGQPLTVTAPGYRHF